MPRLIFTAEPRSASDDGFRERLIDEIAPSLLEVGATELKLGLSLAEPVRAPLLPLKTGPWAMVSATVEIGASAQRLMAHLMGAGFRVQGWQVDPSVPLAYERDWADGEPSPGVALITLFRRNPKLGYPGFLNEWHEHHTPMALEIHPLWNYIRNVVDTAVVDGSAPWDGIVEEHFRSLEDVTNLRRFYGGGWGRTIANMIRVGRHVNGFLDLKTIENHLVREIHVRS